MDVAHVLMHVQAGVLNSHLDVASAKLLSLCSRRLRLPIPLICGRIDKLCFAYYRRLRGHTLFVDILHGSVHTMLLSCDGSKMICNVGKLRRVSLLCTTCYDVFHDWFMHLCSDAGI